MKSSCSLHAVSYPNNIQKEEKLLRQNIQKIIAEIVKTKPSYLAIEDLTVKGMMKNCQLSKVIAAQKFYDFRIKLGAYKSLLIVSDSFRTKADAMKQPDDPIVKSCVFCPYFK